MVLILSAPNRFLSLMERLQRSPWRTLMCRQVANANGSEAVFRFLGTITDEYASALPVSLSEWRVAAS